MIRRVFESFIRDCRTRGLSPFTVNYYESNVKYFMRWCDTEGVCEMEDIVPDVLRRYIEYLQGGDHNEGGVHLKYRAVRTFVLWWGREEEPDNWIKINPIKKVHAPRVSLEPITPVSIEEVHKMEATCGNNFNGIRDKAILYFLLDTGVRVREFHLLNREDVDTVTGQVLIEKGKGGKPRLVFIGKKTRRVVKSYLKSRSDANEALWVTYQAERLQVISLQHILMRRGKDAGIVPTPSPHDFRRAFAINMLRAGVDIFTLMRLMGHTSVEVLRRYLALVTEDMEQAHAAGGPVDRLV